MCLFDYKARKNTYILTFLQVQKSPSNTPINSKLQHPLGKDRTFEDWIVQISAPSGQNSVQMPYPTVEFVRRL